MQDPDNPHAAAQAQAGTLNFSHVQKLGLIGDVHTEDGLLDRALRELRLCGAEVILCVGDITDGQGDLGRCCELLQRHHVLAVGGNHDRWILADLSHDLSDPVVQRRLPTGILSHLASLRKSIPDAAFAYLSTLPSIRTMTTRRGTILLCHGLGSNDTAFVGADDSPAVLHENTELAGLRATCGVRIIFNGHTHRRMVRHFDGLTLVNAGTLHPRQQPGAILVDLMDGHVVWLHLTDGGPTTMERLGNLVSGGE
jgi:predicted phosphodiesterase